MWMQKQLSTSSLVPTVWRRNAQGSAGHGGGMGRMRFLWDAPWREGKEEGSEAKLKKEEWSWMGHA